MCTGITAFVRGVMAASIASGSMLKVRSSTSAKTGVPRSNSTELAEATKEIGVVITSSPGPISAIRTARCRPAVPLDTAAA